MFVQYGDIMNNFPIDNSLNSRQIWNQIKILEKKIADQDRTIMAISMRLNNTGTWRNPVKIGTSFIWTVTLEGETDDIKSLYWKSGVPPTHQYDGKPIITDDPQ